MTEAATQLPPHSLEAELAVLGAVLVDGAVLDEVRPILRADDFYREGHRKVYEAMLAVREQGQPVDIITVAVELELRGDLDAVGGRVFLAGLERESPSISQAPHYARILAGKARARNVMVAAGDIAALAQREDPELLERAQVALLTASFASFADDDIVFERRGLGYVATFPSRVTIEVHALRWSGGELSGELHVTVGSVGLHRARFNLSSSTARATLAKSLSGRSASKVDWLRALEAFCQHILTEERRGEPFEKIGRRPQRPGTRYLVRPMMPVDQPTLLFADGGTGKSYLAVALALSVQVGREIVPGLAPAKKGPVLYLDWETSADEIDERIKAICAGAGIEPVEILYRRCTTSLVDMVEEVAGLIATDEIVLVVVDSLGYALGQGSERGTAEETAIRFFQAVRHLKTTVLGIDHVNKEGAASATGAFKPYGSAYKVNYARSAWEMRKQNDVDGEVVLTHRKANNSRRADPIGLRATFTEDSDGLVVKVQYEAMDVSAPQLMTLAQKTDVLEALCVENPGITTARILELTGLVDSQVSGLLRNLEDQGRIQKLRRGVWGPPSAAGTEEPADV